MHIAKVTSRIVTELCIELRYQLRMLDIQTQWATMIYGDNQSVVISTNIPGNTIEKKHNALAYHKVRESITAGNLLTFQASWIWRSKRYTSVFDYGLSPLTPWAVNFCFVVCWTMTIMGIPVCSHTCLESIKLFCMSGGKTSHVCTCHKFLKFLNAEMVNAQKRMLQK